MGERRYEHSVSPCFLVSFPLFFLPRFLLLLNDPNSGSGESSVQRGMRLRGQNERVRSRMMDEVRRLGDAGDQRSLRQLHEVIKQDPSLEEALWPNKVVPPTPSSQFESSEAFSKKLWKLVDDAEKLDPKNAAQFKRIARLLDSADPSPEDVLALDRLWKENFSKHFDEWFSGFRREYIPGARRLQDQARAIMQAQVTRIENKVAEMTVRQLEAMTGSETMRYAGWSDDWTPALKAKKMQLIEELGTTNKGGLLDMNRVDRVAQAVVEKRKAGMELAEAMAQCTAGAAGTGRSLLAAPFCNVRLIQRLRQRLARLETLQKSSEGMRAVSRATRSASRYVAGAGRAFARVAGAAGAAAGVAAAAHSVTESERKFGSWSDAMDQGQWNGKLLRDAVLGSSTDLLLGGHGSTVTLGEGIGKGAGALYVGATRCSGRWGECTVNAARYSVDAVRRGGRWTVKAVGRAATAVKDCAFSPLECARNTSRSVAGLGSKMWNTVSKWGNDAAEYRARREEKARHRERFCATNKDKCEQEDEQRAANRRQAWKQAVAPVTDFVEEKAEASKRVTSNAVQDVKDFYSDKAQETSDWVKEKKEATKGFLKNAYSDVASAWGSAYDKVKSW